MLGSANLSALSLPPTDLVVALSGDTSHDASGSSSQSGPGMVRHRPVLQPFGSTISRKRSQDSPPWRPKGTAKMVTVGVSSISFF